MIRLPLAAVAIVLSACWSCQQAPVTVVAHMVEIRRIEERLLVEARADWHDDRQLTLDQPVLVSRVLVRPGDQVAKDQVVIETDRNRLLQAKQALQFRRAAGGKRDGETEAGQEYEAVLAQTFLRAPIDGTVVSIGCIAGQVCDPPDRIAVRIASVDRLTVRAEVGAGEVRLLHEKKAASVSQPGMPEPLNCLITGVRPELRLVEVECNDPFRAIDVASPVRLSMLIGAAEGPALPAASFFRYPGSRHGFVVIAEDGVARRRDVEAGLEDGSWVGIRSGVAPGQRVLTGVDGRPPEDGARLTIMTDAR